MTRDQLIKRLHGAYVAAVTPMTDDGDVDHAALENNIGWWNRTDLAGYLLMGSTGEQVHLSEFERALVLEVGRRATPQDRVLIAGTGMNGTRNTIEETKRAAEAGIDAALVVTPNYYQKQMTSSALVAHYLAVAEASPIPVMLYSVPGITGVTLPPEALGELVQHDNIVGMKNSGSDAKVAARYRTAAGETSFPILAGSAHAAPGFLLAGLADGVILAAANGVPEASAALVEAVRQGDIQAARRHGETIRAISDQIAPFGIAGWKAAVVARGYYGGPARRPLRNLTDEELKEIATWMKDHIEG